MQADAQSDIWSDWLLHRRHAGDATFDRHIQDQVERYADKVLDGALLAPGMTLVDVGAGEGLIALRAIDRIGPSLRVILTDISGPMLHHTEATARARGVAEQCRFIQGSAEQLAGIEDGEADVVAMRAVLAYVPDKTAALKECHRVLKPGGRLSIAEPVFQDEALMARALRQIVDNAPAGAADRLMTLLHRWKSAQFPDTEAAIAATPIANYAERDLLRFVNEAGFFDIHLELHIDVFHSPNTSWEVFLGTSPHPLAPSLGSIMHAQFSEEERQFFEHLMRPTVEAGKSVVTDRVVYLTARKA
ncbi:MAG: methyltransferase domain-containing protein [Burkholderiales bacterium]|nr:methyltransferase domain-containing protein [Burkholderiales bacterium]